MGQQAPGSRRLSRCQRGGACRPSCRRRGRWRPAPAAAGQRRNAKQVRSSCLICGGLRMEHPDGPASKGRPLITPSVPHPKQRRPTSTQFCAFWFQTRLPLHACRHTRGQSRQPLELPLCMMQPTLASQSCHRPPYPGPHACRHLPARRAPACCTAQTGGRCRGRQSCRPFPVPAVKVSTAACICCNRIPGRQPAGDAWEPVEIAHHGPQQNAC
jgi:hypothetical protein